MIKFLALTILSASTIWSDPGITVEVKVIIPDYDTGEPKAGEIYRE